MTETISFQSKKMMLTLSVCVVYNVPPILFDFDYKRCGLMIGFAFRFPFFFFGRRSSLARSMDTVVLGGTHQENDYNTNVNDDDTHFIYDGCAKLIPSIKRGTVCAEKVGLRPGRNRVRLEPNLFTPSKHMPHMAQNAVVTIC